MLSLTIIRSCILQATEEAWAARITRRLEIIRELGPAENLGPVINTPYNEDTPF